MKKQSKSKNKKWIEISKREHEEIENKEDNKKVIEFKKAKLTIKYFKR